MITIALVLLALAGACFTVRILLGPSLPDRVVGLDGLVITAVAATLLHAIASDSDRYLDVGLVVAFVGFVATSAAARFVEQRGDRP